METGKRIADSKQKVTSTEIKKALAAYQPKDFFVTECKTCSTYFPDPQGMLKFDGLGIRRSYTRPCITGYEIKVSRSDFRQDAKWHLYLQYCNEFYFVCPAGLIKKDELPDNVGLIWYYPETGKLFKKKKALWREIQPPVGMYEYIIYSRLEPDRLPFYESRAEYAGDYLADKEDKRNLGYRLGSKMAKDLSEAQKRLDTLEHSEEQIELLKKLKAVMKKHGFGRFCWKAEDWVEELDEALKHGCPADLDTVRMHLRNALDKLDAIQAEAGSDEQAEHERGEKLIWD